MLHWREGPHATLAHVTHARVMLHEGHATLAHATRGHATLAHATRGHAVCYTAIRALSIWFCDVLLF